MPIGCVQCKPVQFRIGRKRAPCKLLALPIRLPPDICGDGSDATEALPTSERIEKPINREGAPPRHLYILDPASTALLGSKDSADPGHDVIPVADRRALSFSIVHLCERQIDRRKEAVTHTFIVLYFQVGRVLDASAKRNRRCRPWASRCLLPTHCHSLLRASCQSTRDRHGN